MMLKGMGFDAEDIKVKFDAFKRDGERVINHFFEQNKVIIAKQDAIVEQNALIIAKLEELCQKRQS